MIVLTVRVPGEAPRRVRVEKTVTTLGRASTNDLPLADRTLSRVHARIEAEDGMVRLVDLGSRNGTLLNGTRIETAARLKGGDRIRLGETAIDVSDETSTRVVIDGGPSTVEATLLKSSLDLVLPRTREFDKSLGQAELARLAASLRILNEVSMALLGDMPLPRLLELVLDKVFDTLTPDRGLLMIQDETGELKPQVVKFAEGIDPSDIRLSKTLVHSVFEKRNALLMLDTTMHEDLKASESIRLQGVTSCIAAPLFAEDAVFGLIYLEVRLGRKSFNEDDLRLLTSLANTAAIKIQNVKLEEEAEVKKAIEREMALAWEVQKRLLPERPPVVPHTELCGRTIPSRTVSGDYFDFFVRRDKTLDVVVADVSGKGVAASILAASVQAAYEAWASENFPPDKLCARLNDLIVRRTSPEKFVTLFLAQYDPESGALLYTNAGHNPGILVRADGTFTHLEAHGMPLGLFYGRTYSSGATTLSAGDLLVLYSDGLTEATNVGDEEFGLDRLTAVVRDARTRSLPDIEGDITHALETFVAGVPYADDRTLVMLRRG